MRMERVAGVILLVAGGAALAWWAASPLSHRPSAPVAGAVAPTSVRPAGPLPAWSPGPSPSRGATVLDLVRLPLTLSLPTTNRPDGDAVRTAFTYRNPAPSRGDIYLLDLPFEVPRMTHRIAPPGMRITVDGQEAAFSVNMRGGPGVPLWGLTAEGQLRLRWGAPITRLRVEHPALAARVEALDPSQVHEQGLDPVAWATRRVMDEGVSRSGLILPAPTTATWSGLTLPAGATFVAWPGMAPAPTSDRSDGVVFEVAVASGGSSRVLATRTIEAEQGPEEAWRVDLSAFEGQTIDVTVRTLPRDNTDHDHAFLGAPRIVGQDGDAPRRIIVIGIDTLRPDHLGVYGYPRATSPEIDAWAKDAVVFDQAWTTAPRTRPAFRAATTGRLPLEAVCAPTIGSVFRDHGFVTAGIVANIHLNPRFGFDQGFDLWWLDSGATADTQVDRAIAWLDDHASQDAYLFLHIMDPHIFYVPPEPFRSRLLAGLPPLRPQAELPERFNRWLVYRWMQNDRLFPLQKQHIVGRYDGEIAWTSAQLGRLFERLDALAGDTTVVFHSDHGEEFWDHDGFEHNHTLYDEVTRAALIIRPPGGAGAAHARSPAIASLEDIGPTLYDLAGIDDGPVSDGVSLVPALRGETMDPDRAVGVAHLKYDRDQWGVIWRGHKYVLVTGTGDDALYDLTADPGEHEDRSEDVDIWPWVAKLGEAHHAPSGPGWRVDLATRPGARLTLTLPDKAVAAGVFDPERVTDHPANEVWGEAPRHTVDEVGSASLSDDRRVVTFQAGSHGKGVLWVLWDQPMPVAGSLLRVDDGEVVASEDGRWIRPGAAVVIKPGPLLVPPPDEAARIAACASADHGTQDVGSERALLEALGYVGGGRDDEHGHDGSPPDER